jgi:acyl-CoA synthetase (AMP-forming)/AMP-acid ligase II
MLLSQGLKRSICLTPDSIATTCNGRKRTFRELGERVQKLAGALQNLGMQRGDRVGMWALNSDRYLEYLLAVNWGGGVLLPINYRWSNTEVLYSLEDAEPNIILVDENFRSAAEQIRDEATSLRELIYAGEGTTPQGMHDYEKILDAAAPVEEADLAPNDLAGIFYTGGTTGFPKGVMLSNLNLWSSSFCLAMDGWCPPGTAYLHLAPMFHLADLAATYTNLINGGSHFFLGIFEPTAVFKLIEQEKVSGALLVPTMIQMLVDHPDIGNYQLNSLRQIIYGASPIPQGLLARTLSAFPEATFSQGYGMTELSPICAVLPAEYHTPEGIKLGKLHAAGRPSFITEVRIVDGDDNEVPRGTVGEIIARGPNVMQGYWKRPEQTAEALKNGWMHTGDGGYMDEDGFIFLVDRIKDMIISGGENVYSAEVESAISKHPAVAVSAVIGIPDKKWGETVHAVITLKPDLTATEEEIIEHCKGLIAGYKCPRSVEFSDALPITATGKLQKNELRKPYWENQERNIS